MTYDSRKYEYPGHASKAYWLPEKYMLIKPVACDVMPIHDHHKSEQGHQ